MDIRIITKPISRDELREIAQEFYGEMLKGVVDVKKEIIAVGGEYHMDSNLLLIENGSNQPDIWGINIHLDKDKENWLEYRSLINIRPAQGNRAMELANETIRAKIKEIVNRLIL